MNDIILLQRRKSMTVEFYNRVPKWIDKYCGAKFDLNIVLNDDTRITGRITEIIDGELTLMPHLEVPYKFKFNSNDKEDIIDVYDVKFVYPDE